MAPFHVASKASVMAAAKMTSLGSQVMLSRKPVPVQKANQVTKD